MRIALIGSVTTKIPPDGQAAIERLAYQQALGLANRGHSILLLALKGSRVDHPNVKIIEVGSGETRSGSGAEGNPPAGGNEELYGIAYKFRLEVTNLAEAMMALRKYRDDYDIILNNLRLEAPVVPLVQQIGKPIYQVLHMPIFPTLAAFFKNYNVRLISISNAQRADFPDLNYVGTVYNAVDTTEFGFCAHPQDYVLYLGSIGANKNPKDALLAAKEAGVQIKIGGRIKDQTYYDREIAPHIDGTQVQWVGEKHPKEVIALYQNACAFLFPTIWNEPFGLVAIEALSCGTPVIAYPHGALPEIIDDGVNGYLVNSVGQMATKIKGVGAIKREMCRQTVEQKFTVAKMIAGYEKILSQK